MPLIAFLCFVTCIITGAAAFDLTAVSLACPTTQSPTNGSVTNMNFIATYKCDEGFILIGQRVRFCMLGRWIPGEPECQPSGGCSAPKTVDNGSYSPQTSSYNSGDSVTYSCSNGYKLSSTATVTCRSFGNWDPYPPSCTKTSCGAPTPIANGTFSPSQSGYNHADVLQVICDTGFTPVGEQTIICMTNNMWNAEPAVCKRTCGSPPVPSGGSLKPSKNIYVAGDKVMYSCDGPALIRGAAENKCQDDGNWSASAPTCRAMLFMVNCSSNLYYAPAQKDTWAGAYFECSQQGMHLFVPSTPEETWCVCNAMNTGTLLIESYWTGVTITSVGHITACAQPVMDLWSSENDKLGVTGKVAYLQVKQLHAAGPEQQHYYICEKKLC